MDIRGKILAELEQATGARSAGNEGRARVCARRAAGMAARVFFDRQGVQPLDASPDHDGRARNQSAYVLLQTLAEYPGLAPDLRQAAIHLTLRVTEEFTLPVDVDLIADAKNLCSRLIPM